MICHDANILSHFGHSNKNTKHNCCYSFGLVIPCFIDVPSVNQTSFSSCGSVFIFKVSPCSPSTRQVKLYLIKMLCSLPNSSPHIWFSLFVFCGWATTSIQLNQCLFKRETIWVTFLHVVWYDKAAAGPARNVSRQRATQKHRYVCLLFTITRKPPQPKKRKGFRVLTTTACLWTQLSLPISCRGGTCAFIISNLVLLIWILISALNVKCMLLNTV